MSVSVGCAGEVSCRTKSVYLRKVHLIKDMSPKMLHKTIMPPHFGVKGQYKEWEKISNNRLSVEKNRKYKITMF